MEKKIILYFQIFNFHNKIQQIMQCTNLAAFVCEQINIYITALQIVTITTQHKLGITLSLRVTVHVLQGQLSFLFGDFGQGPRVIGAVSFVGKPLLHLFRGDVPGGGQVLNGVNVGIGML